MFHICVPKILIYSSWDIECDQLKLVIMGHFWPFYPPHKNVKNQNLTKKKKIAGDIIILYMCSKNNNHMNCGSRDTERQTEFFVILGQFLPFYPPKNQKNQNFNKMKKHLSYRPRKLKLEKKHAKQTWRYYLVTHVYHKWRS